MRPSTGLDWALAFLVQSNRQVRASTRFSRASGNPPPRPLPVRVAISQVWGAAGTAARRNSGPFRISTRSSASSGSRIVALLAGRRAQGGAGHVRRREGQDQRRGGGRGAGSAGFGVAGGGARPRPAFFSTGDPPTGSGAFSGFGGGSAGPPRRLRASRPGASTCGAGIPDGPRWDVGDRRRGAAAVAPPRARAAGGGRATGRSRREQGHEARRERRRRRRACAAAAVAGRRSPPSNDSSAASRAARSGSQSRSSRRRRDLSRPEVRGPRRRAGRDRGRAAGLGRAPDGAAEAGVRDVEAFAGAGQVDEGAALGPAGGRQRSTIRALGRRRAFFASAEPSRTPLQVQEMPGGRVVR